MEHSDEIQVDYRCVKCRNTTAVARKINLSKGILPDLLARGGGKYRFITCSLCGYTEIYDLAVIEQANAPAVEPASNPAVEPSSR